jgi:hypothetical protein
MFKVIAITFALAFVSSAQAVPLAPLQQGGDDLIVTVRQACGAGMHRVGGACVRTAARRAARRCATGMTC